MKKVLSLLVLLVTLTTAYAAEGIKFGGGANFATKYVFRGQNVYHTSSKDSMQLSGNVDMSLYQHPEYKLNIWFGMPLQETDIFKDKEIDFDFSWTKAFNKTVKHTVGLKYYMYTEYDDNNDMELYYTATMINARLNPVFTIHLDINDNEVNGVKNESVGNMYFTAAISETWEAAPKVAIDFNAALSLMRKSEKSSVKKDGDYFGLSDLALSASHTYKQERFNVTPALKVIVPLEEDQVQKDTEILLDVKFGF